MNDYIWCNRVVGPRGDSPTSHQQLNIPRVGIEPTYNTVKPSHSCKSISKLCFIQPLTIITFFLQMWSTRNASNTEQASHMEGRSVRQVPQ